MALSFSGWICASTSDRCWKTVLNSTVTFSAAMIAPSWSGTGDGSSGTSRLTNFAPNTVVDSMATRTLDGTRCS